MPQIKPDAAGLDISEAEIVACVPCDRADEPIRFFGTFTPDLEALADWLQACGIKTVAMESTGVYWIPLYELLEERGIEAYVVNARHLKNVPGRKTDVCDAQWIQTLHSYGLLASSFLPDAIWRPLRAYWRHRQSLIAHRAPHIQHMQKALHQMNLQLMQVLADITGVTSMQIIRAIVAGERNPVELARFRDPRCAHSAEHIAEALSGAYRDEHVFALKQALALYDFYTVQIAGAMRRWSNSTAGCWRRQTRTGTRSLRWVPIPRRTPTRRTLRPLMYAPTSTPSLASTSWPSRASTRARY
jgi:hypothetical protein